MWNKGKRARHEDGASAPIPAVNATLGCCGVASVMNIAMRTRFEDLLVWQRARAFCGAVRPVVRSARAAHDFELSQELNGSSISIMSNIAEGHTRRRRRQFAYFLDIAAGSNGEARSCLHLGLDREYVSPREFERLRNDSEEIERMLDSLGSAVRRQRDPQITF